MDNRKMSKDLQRRCIEAKITKLESALIRKVRALGYGQITMIIHNIEGQPIRIEVSSNSSEILNAKDGLDLEGSTYIEDKLS
jgi:hypothetical protein